MSRRHVCLYGDYETMDKTFWTFSWIQLLHQPSTVAHRELYSFHVIQILKRHSSYHRYFHSVKHYKQRTIQNELFHWYSGVHDSPWTGGVDRRTEQGSHLLQLDTLYYRRMLFNPLTHGRFSDQYFKVLWEGDKTKFLYFFSYGHPQQKGLQGQELSGMGASW